jgi:hypothetical protein
METVHIVHLASRGSRIILECGDVSPLSQGADESDATTGETTSHLTKAASCQVTGYAHSIQKTCFRAVWVNEGLSIIQMSPLFLTYE